MLLPSFFPKLPTLVTICESMGIQLRNTRGGEYKEKRQRCESRFHEQKNSIYHKFQPPIQIFSRAMVLLLRLKAWSNMEITELHIKQHFY